MTGATIRGITFITLTCAERDQDQGFLRLFVFFEMSEFVYLRPLL